MAALREEHFEAREELELQSQELEHLRADAHERGAAAAARGAGGGGDAARGANARASVVSASAAGGPMAADDLSVFRAVLTREQMAEGRRTVEALETLKLPDEGAMGARELASWRENKKTIVNSLRTLSSQIYSARARILYEIIQNADDCAFDDDGGVRELYLECSDEALVAYHNERGFQPKDLYAMCQVGESSKLAGSGKIGRKGIGFKSVFQITDAPVVVSPPFQFRFDTAARGVFGFIVPSWIERPDEHVPPRHHALLRRVCPEAGGVSRAGTLLVCPFAARVDGGEIMRDLSFDGLSLAFLKNLQQISFVASAAAPEPTTPRGPSSTSTAACASGIASSARRSLRRCRTRRQRAATVLESS